MTTPDKPFPNDPIRQAGYDAARVKRTPIVVVLTPDLIKKVWRKSAENKMSFDEFIAALIEAS